MHFITAAALVAASSLSFTSAQAVRGFNTGSSSASGAKMQSDFQSEMANMKKLVGTDGVFTNTRLYTMIQDGTTNAPISAIPAAIATNTGLLLGLWASGGQAGFNNELTALTAAIKQYGTQMSSLVRGISVGSEDLYRISETGIANNDGVGAGPAILTSYINQVKNAIKGTALENAPIGHVDTWNAWTNSSNSAVAEACDWVGVDEYPYYQSQDPNDITQASKLFYNAYDAVKSATGKDVWVTETGYPTSGPTVGQAVASVANAHNYWQQIYCTLPDSVPVYWYTQTDDEAAGGAQFGVEGSSLTSTPAYSLTCSKNTTSSSSSSSSSASSTKVSSHDSTATKTGESKPTGSGALGSKSTLTSAPYPTGGVAENGATVVATGTGFGTGVGTGVATSTMVVNPTTPTGTSSVKPTSTFTPNSANSVQSTLALLAVPALLALFL